MMGKLAVLMYRLPCKLYYKYYKFYYSNYINSDSNAKNNVYLSY